MDATAQELLARFAQHASRRVLRAGDWEMFDAFVGCVVTSGAAIAPETVAEILKEHGWAEDQAGRVAIAYGHQVRLLSNVKR